MILTYHAAVSDVTNYLSDGGLTFGQTQARSIPFSAAGFCQLATCYQCFDCASHCAI
jgi:hypothetical protein